MSVYERIAGSVPVNKTAAVVAGGSSADDALTARQMRENLLPMIAKLEAEIKNSQTKEQRKELGLRKLELQHALTKLKGGAKLRPSYPAHFIEAARSILSPAMYRIIAEEAFRRTNQKTAPD